MAWRRRGCSVQGIHGKAVPGVIVPTGGLAGGTMGYCERVIVAIATLVHR